MQDTLQEPQTLGAGQGRLWYAVSDKEEGGGELIRIFVTEILQFNTSAEVAIVV